VRDVSVQVRRELVFLAMATMEACAVGPVLIALLSWIKPVKPSVVMAVFWGALVAIHYVVRLSLWLSLPPLLHSSLLVLGMVLSSSFAVHGLLHPRVRLWNLAWVGDAFYSLRRGGTSLDAIVFLIVLFCWWRGIVLARCRLDSGTVTSRFRSGMVMLAVAMVIGGYIFALPPYQFVFGYFFVSLLGVALARAEEVGQQYGGGQSPFSLGWLAMVVSATLAVLLLSAGLATVLTGENVGRFIAPMLAFQRSLLELLGYVLGIAFGWLVELLYKILQSIFDGLDSSDLEGILTMPEMEGTMPGQAAVTSEHMVMVKVIVIACGLLALLLVLAFAPRRRHARDRRPPGDERESVWDEFDLRRSLRDLWDEGRRRLNEGAAALGRSLLGQFFVALTIRRIYAHLSALAAELGYPRADDQTPYEYQPILTQAFPEYPEEVAHITTAYVAVHYGEVPERPEELEVIQAAWRQLREAAEAAAR
jgi:hypothetical protein